MEGENTQNKTTFSPPLLRSSCFFSKRVVQRKKPAKLNSDDKHGYAPKRRPDSPTIFMSASFHDKRACMRKNDDDATPERCCGWPIILALVSVHVDDHDEGRSTESSVLLLLRLLVAWQTNT